MISKIVFLFQAEQDIINELYHSFLPYKNSEIFVELEEESISDTYDDETTVFVSFNEKELPYKNVIRVSYFDLRNNDLVNGKIGKDINFYLGYPLFKDYRQLNMFVPNILNLNNTTIYENIQNNLCLRCAVYNHENLGVIMSRLSDDIKSKVKFVPIKTFDELKEVSKKIDGYMLTSWDIADWLLMEQCQMNKLITCHTRKKEVEYMSIPNIYRIIELLFTKDRNRYIFNNYLNLYRQMATVEDFIQYAVRKFG